MLDDSFSNKLLIHLLITIVRIQSHILFFLIQTSTLNEYLYRGNSASTK
jgi:hypothetical protein